MSLTPTATFTALLVVQTLHLLHHRLARRHISFVEVVASATLCVPLDALPAGVLCAGHLVLAGIQVVGSVWIRRLSPAWDDGPPAAGGSPGPQ